MFKFLLSKLADKKEDVSFWEHVDALRSFLIKSILAIFLFSVITFFLKDFIFNVIILYPKSSDFITYRVFCKLGNMLNTDSLCMGDIDFSLINLSLGGQFRWHIIISLISGLIVAIPFILWQLWHFVRPALKSEEIRYSKRAIFYIIFLFSFGLFFGYYLILPLTIQFLGNYVLSDQITNQISINSYISNVCIIPLSIGIIFELPALVYFLSKTEIVSSEFLRKKRKYSIIVVLIVAAIITPSTDAFTMMVVALPLYALYEISIFIACRVEKKKNKI